MAKLPFALGDAEKEIDNWALWYHSPAHKAYMGKLFVTNKRAFFMSDDKGVSLDISKDQINSVEEKKSMMSKCAEITLKDGTIHTFDRGMLSAEKVVTALNQR